MSFQWHLPGSFYCLTIFLTIDCWPFWLLSILFILIVNIIVNRLLFFSPLVIVNARVNIIFFKNSIVMIPHTLHTLLLVICLGREFQPTIACSGCGCIFKQAHLVKVFNNGSTNCHFLKLLYIEIYYKEKQEKVSKYWLPVEKLKKS